MVSPDAGPTPRVRVVDTRYGPMIVDPTDIYIGRSLVTYGEFSPGEGALFRQLLRSGDTVVEAGAHIGSLTLCLAHCVGPFGRVFAFEPQRNLFQMLCGSLALNEVTHVEAWPVGVGAQIGEMIAPPVTGSFAGNSGGHALKTDGPGERVPITTVDNLGLGACDMIKADVQGMERDVLEGAKATIETLQPVLYLENDQQGLSAALLSVVDAMGYRAFWHLPKLYEAENFNGETEDIFPQTASINLLCLPAGHGFDTGGLRPVSGINDWWNTP